MEDAGIFQPQRKVRHKFYTLSAPAGAAKTTSALLFAGHSIEKAGEKVVISQPSIELIDQSIYQFARRFPHVKATAIHSENCANVARAISEHTTAANDGEVLFVTHAALIRAPFWHRRPDWHLIVDEAPDATYTCEIVLPANYASILPCLATGRYNVKYSRLVPGDDAALSEIAENKGQDQYFRTIQDFAQKLKSQKWDMFVTNEQFAKFSTGGDGGRLLVFGLLDPCVLLGFSSVTLMSANLENTIFYQHLSQAGHVMRTHPYIEKGLRFDSHGNGQLLTVHYALEGSWSKYKRNQIVKLDGDAYTVNQIIVSGALDVFGDEPFAKLYNKLDRDMTEDPFGGMGELLPHSTYGLNSFQHLHNAAILPALHPTPAFYTFLDEVSHLDSDQVRNALYHEKIYQAAARISIRNPDDLTPKKLVVADRAAAEAVAALYPGATIKRLPFVEYLPEKKSLGRPRNPTQKAEAERIAEYRINRKTEILTGLDEVNLFVRKLPIYYKDIFVQTREEQGIFGGSIFEDIYSTTAIFQTDGFVSVSGFVEFLKEQHSRTKPKAEAFLWCPAEFDPDKVAETDRGLKNITALSGVWLDNDGGDLSIEDFVSMFPHLAMVLYNSASSTPARPRYRVVIPTTCLMTKEAYDEIMSQIFQVLNRRGYFDKRQLEKRAAKGQAGKHHGFDTSKVTASSLFYLPVQAEIGPHASFFLEYMNGSRRPINPYQWVDKSIINHKPEPVIEPPTDPVHFTGDDSSAIEIWRSHAKGTGNHEFFMLAARLKHNGTARHQISQILYQEAIYAHGTESVRVRRQAIPKILQYLKL